MANVDLETCRFWAQLFGEAGQVRADDYSVPGARSFAAQGPLAPSDLHRERSPSFRRPRAMSTDIEQGGPVSVQRGSSVMAEFVFLPPVERISVNTDAVARLQPSSNIFAHPFVLQPQP